jgi:hypothetical protein
VQTLPAVFNERLIETRVSTIRPDDESAGWTVVLVP